MIAGINRWFYRFGKLIIVLAGIGVFCICTFGAGEIWLGLGLGILVIVAGFWLVNRQEEYYDDLTADHRHGRITSCSRTSLIC